VIGENTLASHPSDGFLHFFYAKGLFLLKKIVRKKSRPNSKYFAGFEPHQPVISCDLYFFKEKPLEMF
jgi:hypothetical protein